MQEPIFSDIHKENILNIGTRIDIKEMLQLPEKHVFLFNASDYPQSELTQSLLSRLVSVGGVKFLTEFFNKNAFFRIRMTESKNKLTLAKAIEKYLEYSENPDLKLIFFYLYFYIKTEGIDLETLTVTQPAYVLSFESWKSSLTPEVIEKIQSPGDLWKGLDLIGKRIQSPDIEKNGRTRNRAISLFVSDTTYEQSDDAI